jgi:L-ascorbate metabolism protein UlaG (beta-lactamase superfamily)
MKRLLAILGILCLLSAGAPALAAETAAPTETPPPATLLYQGHASLRITTGEGKTIYVDPYAGDGYDVPADLILVTHKHEDHYKLKLIKTKNPDCQTITNSEALANGVYGTFDLGYVTVEAVQAGNNPNHDIRVCVGYILTFSDGKTAYVSGDTSKTDQMAAFAARNLDYAFFCCDGKYNMDAKEAAACADLVGAKHSVPYHTQVGKLFSQKIADKFDAQNKLVLQPGEEITIE